MTLTEVSRSYRKFRNLLAEILKTHLPSKNTSKCIFFTFVLILFDLTLPQCLLVCNNKILRFTETFHRIPTN